MQTVTVEIHVGCRTGAGENNWVSVIAAAIGIADVHVNAAMTHEAIILVRANFHLGNLLRQRLIRNRVWSTELPLSGCSLAVKVFCLLRQQLVELLEFNILIATAVFVVLGVLSARNVAASVRLHFPIDRVVTLFPWSLCHFALS